MMGKAEWAHALVGGKGTWCCRQAARCARGAEGSNGRKAICAGAEDS